MRERANVTFAPTGGRMPGGSGLEYNVINDNKENPNENKIVRASSGADASDQPGTTGTGDEGLPEEQRRIVD